MAVRHRNLCLGGRVCGEACVFVQAYSTEYARGGRQACQCAAWKFEEKPAVGLLLAAALSQTAKTAPNGVPSHSVAKVPPTQRVSHNLYN